MIDSQFAKGWTWIGGVWNGEISAPEIYTSGPEMSRGIPCFAG